MMRSTSQTAQRRLALLLLAFGLAILAPGTAAPALPSLGEVAGLFAPDLGIARLAAVPRPLSPRDYAELALRASGVPEADLDRRRAQVQAILDKASAQIQGSGKLTKEGVAEACLGFLHTTVFTAYEENATRLDQILDTGRYNCVSSAVLYLLVLKSQGIEAYGVKTRDHAFASLSLGGRVIDVETTNPYGYDPGTKKEFSNAFGKATGYRYVPPANYGDRENIDEVELAALILSNRIAILETGRRYVEALPLGLGYLELYGGTDGRRIFLDCVENLASVYGNRGDYEAVDALAQAASPFVGSDPRLAKLLETGAYNRATLAISKGDWKGGLAMAKEAYGAGRLGKGPYEALLVYAYGSGAQALGSAGDWLGAAALAEEGARQSPSDRSLAKAAGLYRKNFAVVKHNAFVSLYNRGDYAGAVKVIEEALKSLPGDPDLLADLAAGKKAAGLKP